MGNIAFKAVVFCLSLEIKIMLRSVNPYNGEVIATFKELSEEEINKLLETAEGAFKEWRKTSYEHRANLLRKAAEELRSKKEKLAISMTREMGKPISQSYAEIEKCAWVCEFYADKGAEHLANEAMPSDAEESYVSYEPLGVVLAVMPWNYPFWQVFRFAAPVLMAGNVGVLKHASNVMQVAKNIEEIFLSAGFPEGCFLSLQVSSKAVDGIIRDERIKAVTLTGSTGAGSAVASTAGEEIKKTLLELGGSNAMVVFEDASLEETVKKVIQARFQNTGQSCIAGKRLLLQESIADKFLSLLKAGVERLKSGDPLDEETYIGVLAREDLAEELELQVEKSVEAGARILIGGQRKAAFYEPTVLVDVTKDMSVFKEETFGPVLASMTFKEESEAVELVNSSSFGLGVSIFTQDKKRAKKLIPQFEEGAVFVNELVKSDPRLPFGGTKKSGYGRELSYHGIREFVNIKTVYFNNF